MTNTALFDGAVGAEGRRAFLERLLSQYGSGGWIAGDGEAYRYYSEWYIGGYAGDWSAETPWCGCFLSWAVARESEALDGDAPRFADVELGTYWFRDAGRWKGSAGAYRPLPGDYIFFDLDGGNDPGHVGAVLFTEGDVLYTIEGNCGGRVEICRCRLDDARIVGYGVLPWRT